MFKLDLISFYNVDIQDIFHTATPSKVNVIPNIIQASQASFCHFY
jgi:hypothetical protein